MFYFKTKVHTLPQANASGRVWTFVNNTVFKLNEIIQFKISVLSRIMFYKIKPVLSPKVKTFNVKDIIIVYHPIKIVLTHTHSHDT